MDPLLWSLLLMAIAIGLVVLEVFIPSAGILGGLSAIAVIASVGIAYYRLGPAYGTMMLAVALVAFPIVVASALRWWPHTPIGRMFVIHPPEQAEVLPDTEQTRAFEDLLGKHGIAKSPLLPAGAVIVESTTIDAVSQGEAIDKGDPIVVIHVEGNHVVVRRINDTENRGGLFEQSVNKEDRATGDVLSQPADVLGIDPLDDPLA